MVVVVNKWDQVDTKKWTQDTYGTEVQTQLRHASWAPVVCTTASEGKKVDAVIDEILEAGKQHRKRVPTATLNLVVREAVAWKAPPSLRGSGRQGRVYYATQVAVRPPSFVMFVNDTKLFSDDYRR